MQVCKITLITSVDGKETQIVRTGKVLLSLSRSVVTYREETAEIILVFEKGGVTIERQGDYGLSLVLRQGKFSDGTLGFGGSVGGIRAYARKTAYSIGKDSLLAALHYDLIFGEERQEMRLRLYVKTA